MRFGSLRRHRWLVLDGFAVAVVATLIALIGLGVLVLPSTAAPTVTVSSVTLHIVEGNDSFGWGWFGNSTQVLGAQDGYPVQVGSGGHFTATLDLPVEDNHNHSAVSISAASPFWVTGTRPQLPAQATIGDEDWVLEVIVQVPSVSSSQSESVTLTLVTE